MGIKKIETLKQFYGLMNGTREARARMVKSILADEKASPEDVALLRDSLAALEEIPSEGDNVCLKLDDSRKIETQLTYETSELRKDIFYLENGEEEFIRHLDEIHPGFSDEVLEGAGRLRGINFNNFITDRDGTINNYCGRYRSSIQSVYNSVFISRFAAKRTSNSIIITSAPLANPGILDVSIDPPKTFIYAASKAREYVDHEGRRHTYPVDSFQQAKLDELNRELSALVSKPEYEKYSLIGSGLQFKFGQTTIARQDIGGSIPEDESLLFLELLKEMVSRLDPKHEFFVTEDTGYDLEIILTVKGKRDGSAPKDFDKASGIEFLNDELGLDMESGPNLISGDTPSDLCMIKVSASRTKDTWAVFVTRDGELAKKVRGLTPNNHIVSGPDVLVTILNTLAKE